MEFTNAYNSTVSQKEGNLLPSSYEFRFNDASPTVDELDDSYGAMQYIDMFNQAQCKDSGTVQHILQTIDKENLIQSAQRCSLIRYVYEIVAVGDSYEDLAKSAIEHGRLDDMMMITKPTNPEEDVNMKSWSLRLREYGESDKNKRYGTRKRSSMSKEREALRSMGPILLKKFVGPVNLSNPDCPLHVLEGLNFDLLENENGNDSSGSDRFKTQCNVLVRGIATGMRTSIIAPNSRICITRTPLCPIAAFLLCNLARVKDGDCVLDPFAGSCTTLLASTMMAKNVKTVGVEIAPDDAVNRENIIKDFESRGLALPQLLIQGDITNERIRDEARDAIRKDGGINDIEDLGIFDAIIADPPYGIRETMNDSNTNLDDDIPPLVRFIECMAEDRLNSKPLLRKGGRLVAFVPTFVREDINDGLPQSDLLKRAGLEFVGMTEQPMSHLSRWLVVYRCTH